MAMKTRPSKGLSRKSVIRRMILLGVLALATVSVSYPDPLNKVIAKVNQATSWSIPAVHAPFVLGLDLQGGTRLEYVADTSKVAPGDEKNALDGVRDVIERRVNTIGVSEPVISTAKAGNEWRVAVELAGIRDVNQAIKLIGETPLLEFKEQNTDAPRTLTADEKKKMDADNAAAEKAAQDALTRALKDPGSFEQIVREVSQDPTTKAKGGDLGFIKDNVGLSEIYDPVKEDTAGTMHPTVISTAAYDVVAKVEEIKDAGMEIEASHILIAFAGASNSTSTRTKDDAKKLIDSIKAQATPQNFATLAKKYSEDPSTATKGGDLGWFGKGVMVEQFEGPAFALKVGEISAPVESAFGYHLILKVAERPQKDVRVRAAFFKKTQESDILGPQDQWKNTTLSGKNLKRSELTFDQRLGGAQVSLVFDDEGSKLFAEITKRNIGKPVGIFLDGQPISTPTVNQEITGGQAVITGSFSINEAKLLAQRLNAGALPVPINLIAQQSVGPTLGQDSVQASMVAGLWGLLFIAVFMIGWYRLPGLLSVITLGLYVALSMTIFKILPVTLTLSGIAGFILSLGIAVDANVLVFERLKEELGAGKPLPIAIEEAFVRAWSSIRDGNATTLISCVVLYWFSSSVIKGFALTLLIGVLLSMFSAIVAARSVLRFVVGFPVVRTWTWLFPGMKRPEEPKPTV